MPNSQPPPDFDLSGKAETNTFRLRDSWIGTRLEVLELSRDGTSRWKRARGRIVVLIMGGSSNG